MYASVEDIRAEGVSEEEASNERLTSKITEAMAFIDHVTGWFFEPRERRFRMDGRGTSSLVPPAPPIEVLELRVGDHALELEEGDLALEGAPVEGAFSGPRITWRKGIFPKGRQNIEIQGWFGTTERDGSDRGRVPLLIKKACILLVLRNLHPLGSEASVEARQRHRVTEEKTRDQSIKYSPLKTSRDEGRSGDPEIDGILELYLRPSMQGAV